MKITNFLLSENQFGLNIGDFSRQHSRSGIMSVRGHPKTTWIYEVYKHFLQNSKCLLNMTYIPHNCLLKLVLESRIHSFWCSSSDLDLCNVFETKLNFTSPDF